MLAIAGTVAGILGLSPAAVGQPCKTVTIATGTDSYGLKLNNNDEIVWSQRNEDEDSYTVWSNKRGQISFNRFSKYDRSPGINDAGEIIWRFGIAGQDRPGIESNIRGLIYSEQEGENFAYSGTHHINNGGEIIWISRLFLGQYWATEIFSNERGRITFSTRGTRIGAPAINDSGEVVYITSELPSGSMERRYDILSSERGKITDDGIIKRNPGVNNMGEIVWEQFADTTFPYKWDIWSSVRGRITDNGTKNYEPAINNSGEIVWSFWDGKDWEIASSVRGQITDNNLDDRQPQVNSRGTVVWLASSFTGSSRNPIYSVVATYDTDCGTKIRIYKPSVLSVGADGTDSPTCGSIVNKCRSISQAIRNATAGDTINVYPGVYGDINRNGLIGEPGEESGGPDCNCMIHVDKPVRIWSQYGRKSSLIDASTTDLKAIHIDAKRVEIGYRDRGFTIKGSAATGAITTDRSGGREPPGFEVFVSIWGNKIHAGAWGISGSNLKVYGNNIVGATVGPAIDAGKNALVNGNTILSSEEGIIIADGRIAHNVIIGGGEAIQIYDARFAQVKYNYIVSNRYAGVTVYPASDDEDVDVLITDNNIIGNGLANGELCGVRNLSGGIVLATRNYWGSVSPGTENGACDVSDGSKTITTNPDLEPGAFPSDFRNTQ
jgi:hypothetical protein